MGTRDDVLRDKIEVSLDGRQVFYLFFGAAVLCALVFVLGVMIGRRVEARSHHATPVELTQDPLAALDQLEAQGKNDALLFPKALAGDREVLDEVDQKLEAAEPPPAALEEPAPAEAAAAAATPAPAPAAAPAPAPAPAPAAAPAPAPALDADADKKTAKAEKPADKVADKPADKPAPPPAEKPKANTGAGKFTLQLSSFQDKAEAEGFAEKLKQNGFQPYLAEAEVQGRGRFYRVRVGKYPSYDAAVEAKAAFEKKQKTIAYVTRLPD